MGFCFDELISLLLQEAQSLANQDVLNSDDQAFVTSFKFKAQQGRNQNNRPSKGNHALLPMMRRRKGAIIVVYQAMKLVNVERGKLKREEKTSRS